MSVAIALPVAALPPTTAEAAVIDLMAALHSPWHPPIEGVTAAALVRLCALLGHSEAGTRMALSRLARRGVLARDRRGFYGFGAANAAPQREAAGWPDRLERLVEPWDESWIGLILADPARPPLGLELALKRRGFRALNRSLWLRPANLVDAMADLSGAADLDLRQAGGVLARLSELDPETRADVVRLWEVPALEAFYHETPARLAEATRLMRTQSAAEAFRLSHAHGGAATRAILVDPLLPAALVNAPARRACFEALLAFHTESARYWADVIGDGRR